ncbi:unnamed protein product [Cyclocybe aegerita]|uniref:BTB domain-containing protein n=1 Tax=Cyclocybe aegerita TaxID=1973307 RepID=A0A8S0XX32_CYCAE|nr:unnamed protein product [Cyclocybe aegerita]
MDSHETWPKSSPKSTVVRHPEFYFADGSIILIIEKTALRIHQSVLTHHSEVFKGLWDVPQLSKLEMYDGCPSVVLSDSVNNLIDVMRPSHFDKIAPETSLMELVTFISGILRISTKYGMLQIRQKCISIIQDKFPSMLAGCDNILRCKIQYMPSEIIRVIPLAREMNIPHVLPWAFYLCAQISVEELLENQMLSWQDKALCLAGKENLWEMQCTVTHTFLLNFWPSPHCSTGCKMRMPTTFTLKDFESLRTSPHLLGEYQDWTGLRLCAKCQAFAQAQHQEGREKVWQKLPGLFHLGTWDDIFKDQSC